MQASINTAHTNYYIRCSEKIEDETDLPNTIQTYINADYSKHIYVDGAPTEFSESFIYASNDEISTSVVSLYFIFESGNSTCNYLKNIEFDFSVSAVSVYFRSMLFDPSNLAYYSIVDDGSENAEVYDLEFKITNAQDIDITGISFNSLSGGFMKLIGNLSINLAYFTSTNQIQFTGEMTSIGTLTDSYIQTIQEAFQFQAFDSFTVDNLSLRKNTNGLILAFYMANINTIVVQNSLVELNKAGNIFQILNVLDLTIDNSIFQRNSPQASQTLMITAALLFEIKNCYFYQNYNYGGLFLTGGSETTTFLATGTMDNCIFEDNKNALNTGGGAKIANIQTFSMTNSKFLFNDQLEYKTAGGGMVLDTFNETSGYILIDNCYFEGNKAYYGAALGMRQVADVLLKNSQFIDNQAETSGGGFYYIDIIGLTVQGSSFVNNFAVNSGSGIAGLFYAQTLNTNGERIPFLDIDSCNFSENFNEGMGGGMYIFRVNEVRILDSIFDQNDAVFGAGAMMSQADILEINNCQFTKNKGGSGSAVMNMFGEQVDVENCDFLENEANELNGGILNINHIGIDNSQVILKNLLFQDNVGIGGTLKLKSLTCIYSMLSDIQFINNYGNNSATGQFYFEEINYLNIENMSFTDNYGGSAIQGIQIYNTNFNNIQAVNNTGGIKIISKGQNMLFDKIMISDSTESGGFQIKQSQNISISNSEFDNNYTPYDGAGLFAIQCIEIQMFNVNFTKNKAYQGGGLILKNVENAIFDNILIQENVVDYLGGGMLVQVSKNCTFNNLNILQNTAVTYSGGIHLANSENIKLKNSTVSLNEAKQGGAFSSVSSQYIEIQNVKINENTGILVGGGLFLQFSDHIYVQNLQLFENEAYKLEGGGIYCENCQNFTLNYSQIKENTGTGLQIYESSKIQILNSIFKSHKNLEKGAAFSGENVDEILIENSVFKEHFSSSKGGAFYLQGGDSLIIRKSQFVNNSLSVPENLSEKSSLGGNIYLEEVVQVEIEDVVFSDSFANYKGGCLYMNEVYQISIQNSLFNNCSVYYDKEKDILEKEYDYFISQGGGIYLTNSKKNKQNGRRDLASTDILYFLLRNSQFSNNAAQSGGGILISQLQEQEWDITISQQNQFTNNLADYGASIRFLGFYDSEFETNFIKEENLYFNNTSVMADNQHLYFGYARNEVLKSSDSTDFTLCFSGSYLMDGGTSSCKPCFENAICNGGYSYPYPIAGYWRNSETLESYLYCEQKPEACLGKDECLEGYRGIRCSECRSDLQLVKEGSECVSCIDSEWIKLQTLGNTVFSLVLVLLSMKSIQTKVDMAIQRRILNIWDFPLLQEWQFSAIMKLFMTHTQIISLTSSFIADYPSSYVSFNDYFGNPVKVVSSGLKCLFEYQTEEDYYLIKAKARILGLFIFAVTLFSIQLVLIIMCLVKIVSKYNLRALCISASICMYITIQPGVIINAINDLQCVTVGEIRYAVFDSTVICNEGFYNSYLLPLNIFLITLMVILVPGILIRNLVKAKNRLEHHSQMKRAYGILYLEVKHSKFYWEFISMFEKLLIIIVQIVYQDYLIVKSALSAIIIMVYLILLIQIRPFYTVSLNNVAILSAFAQIMTLLFGIGMYEDKQWFILFGLICIIAINMLFLYKIIKILIPEKYTEMRPLLIKLADKLKFLGFIKFKLKREIKAKIRWVCLRDAVFWYYSVNKKENMNFRIKQFQENQKKLYCILKINKLFKKVKNNQIGNFLEEKAKIQIMPAKKQNQEYLKLYMAKWRKNAKKLGSQQEKEHFGSNDEIGHIKNFNEKYQAQQNEKNNFSRQQTQFSKGLILSQENLKNNSSSSGDNLEQPILININSKINFEDQSVQKQENQDKIIQKSDEKQDTEIASDFDYMNPESDNNLVEKMTGRNWSKKYNQKNQQQLQTKSQNSFPLISQDLSSVRHALLASQDEQQDFQQGGETNRKNFSAEDQQEEENQEQRQEKNEDEEEKEKEQEKYQLQNQKIDNNNINNNGIKENNIDTNRGNQTNNKNEQIENDTIEKEINDDNEVKIQDFLTNNDNNQNIDGQITSPNKSQDSGIKLNEESRKSNENLLKQSSDSLTSIISNSNENIALKESVWNQDPLKSKYSTKQENSRYDFNKKQQEERENKIKQKSSQISNIYITQKSGMNDKKRKLKKKFNIQNDLQGQNNQNINNKQKLNSQQNTYQANLFTSQNDKQLYNDEDSKQGIVNQNYINSSNNVNKDITINNNSSINQNNKNNLVEATVGAQKRVSKYSSTQNFQNDQSQNLTSIINLDDNNSKEQYKNNNINDNNQNALKGQGNIEEIQE